MTTAEWVMALLVLVPVFAGFLGIAYHLLANLWDEVQDRRCQCRHLHRHQGRHDVTCRMYRGRS